MQAIQGTKREGWGQGEGCVWPGHVLRTFRGIEVKPVRMIGPRDSEILTLAVQSFGYLLPNNAVDTLAGFACRIEMACACPKARAVADTLHRLSA